MTDPSSAPLTRMTLLLDIRDPQNAEAWRTFVELYTPLIYSFCVRRGLQEADCRDVLQNVLTSVHRQIRTFEYDPQRGLFRNWLITIIVRQIQRDQSRMKGDTRGLGGGLGDQLAEQVEAEVDASWTEEFHSRVCQFAMDRIRGEFSPAVWQTFEATWFHERKPAQVARELGRPAAWVYKAKYRVLKRLKQEIEFLTDEHPANLLE